MNVVHLFRRLCCFSPPVDAHVAALNPSSASSVYSATASRALSSGNGTDGAFNATTGSLAVRASTTSIAGFIALWTAFTYIYIVYHGSSLAQGVALPVKGFTRGLVSLLKGAWVPYLVSPLDPDDRTRIRIACLQPRRLKKSDAKPEETASNQNVHFASGYMESRQAPPFNEKDPGRQVWFQSASPAMKHLTTAAMWQFWSLWMAAAMVVLTAIYNGFIFGQRGPDAVVRLILVCIYAGINLASAIAFYHYFQQALNAVSNQACWVEISNGFVFFDRSNHVSSLYKLENPADGKYTFTGLTIIRSI